MVVSVLLSLVGIVFLGVTSFRHGSSRATCILRQNKLQKIAVSYANLNEFEAGDTVPDLISTLVADRYIVQTPVCPSEGTYTFLDHIPRLGENFVTCSIATHATD